jgi:drug/metabolite transporter (DMT)-like permease
MIALIYALSGNLCFSIASLGFTHYSRKISAQWMNCYKAIVSLVMSVLVIWLFKIPMPQFDFKISLLLVSGFLGLCIGDLFMLEAMKAIGGSRMVMMFGLTPFLTGVGSWYFFSAKLPLMSWVGVLLMVCCLFLLSLERYKVSGNWQKNGIIMGVLAVAFDAIGLLITKNAFQGNADPLAVNFWRLVGAMFGFLLLDRFYQRIHLSKELIKLSWIQRAQVTVFGIMGPFLSLQLYFTAVSMGHLSVVSSVAGTGPLFTQIFESVIERKWPHPLWFAAFLCMIGGFWCFGFSQS